MQFMEVHMTKHFLPDLFGRQATGSDIFSSLQREIDQVFRDFGRTLPVLSEPRDGLLAVKFNVAETDKTVEVTADIPGVDVKDIDVQLREDVLTIKGEKKAEKDEKQKDYPWSNVPMACSSARSRCPPASWPTRSRLRSTRAC